GITLVDGFIALTRKREPHPESTRVEARPVAVRPPDMSDNLSRMRWIRGRSVRRPSRPPGLSVNLGRNAMATPHLNGSLHSELRHYFSGRFHRFDQEERTASRIHSR